MQTTKLGPFLGINNRLPDFALNAEAGRWLRAADNVDVTNSGNLVRRKAAVLVQALSSPHSLFNGYMVRSSALYAVTLPTYGETLVKVLSSNAPMSYCAFNGDIYYSNGTDSGRISESGTWYPLALPTPDAPSASYIGGSLIAGKYQIAVSYANATTGEEGGVSASTNYELAMDGGIRVNLPAATTGATHVNVYVSTLNGSIPMLAATVASGTATVDVVSESTGREANQRYEAPLPVGTRIFMFNGRLCSISGNSLYYGIPHRPGYYLPSEGMIQFPENISIAIGNQLGLYVVADKTYFLQGTDLGTVELVRDVLPYGAVPGTEFEVPNKPVVGWFGKNGIVLADTQGQAIAVMEANFDVTPPASGISIVFETRGYRRVVSCGWCVNLGNNAATTYSGYDFTSASNGYGAKADGVYSLEADGGTVDAEIGFGKEDFGAENEKRMPAVYLGCTSDEPLELGVTTPDDDDYRYEARSCGDAMNIHRVDIGKGLRANWFDLTIRNLEGSDFTLASVSFAPVASGRRI